MASKTKTNTTEDTPTDDGNTAALGGMDFNVEDEYKADPLIEKGTFHGVVTQVTFNPEQSCIIWDICLHDNGGVMNDGESAIDGAHVWFRNWLPKAGDENELTKSGKTNKRQSKINMLGDFAEALGLDMSTPKAIMTALEEAQWIGIEVDADIDIDEWNGKFRNQVNRLKKSTMF